MQTAKEYLTELKATLPEAQFNAYAIAHINRYIGVSPEVVGGTCNSNNCHGRSGCTPRTQNGDCECIDKDTCGWVSDL